MGADGVVVGSSCFYASPCVVQTRMPALVQAFISKLPVETLDECILDRLAGIDKVQGHRMCVSPLIHGTTVLASGHRDGRSRAAGDQQRLESRRLDCCTRHNGSGLCCERGPLWTRPLLPHRTLLPPNGPRRIVVRSRYPASRRERLECAKPNNPDWHYRPVVPARDVFGKISKGNASRCFLVSLSRAAPFCCWLPETHPGPSCSLKAVSRLGTARTTGPFQNTAAGASFHCE